MKDIDQMFLGAFLASVIFWLATSGAISFNVFTDATVSQGQGAQHVDMLLSQK